MKKVNTKEFKKNSGEGGQLDEFVDSVLRPETWDDYIGQKKIKKGLKVMLGAAKKRNESSDHLLFYGQPGLGKTTLASLVAKEMKANLRIVSAPTLSRIGDLAAILSNLEEGEVFFIDEAHRISRPIEELLYSALDNGKIVLMVGKGPSARQIFLDLPPFTLVAATTRVNLISSPLRSRFGAIFRFDYYEKAEIEEIIGRSAEILKIKIEPEAVVLIGRAARFTPRTANRLLKRARDVAQMKDEKIIKKETVLETFEMLEIDEMGLEAHDRKLLETMIKKFNGRPAGINALSAALGEEKGVIEEVYEPYLIKIGFLHRTSSGRVATEEARRWLLIKSFI